MRILELALSLLSLKCDPFSFIRLTIDNDSEQLKEKQSMRDNGAHRYYLYDIVMKCRMWNKKFHFNFILI